MPATTPLVLWQPSAERIENATLTRYQGWLEERLGRSFAGYDELWQWSVDDVEGFWASIWDFFEVQASTPTSGCSAAARCRARSGSRARG